MAHEVIMPALGMAQSEGVILRWLKDVGEAVAPGEALMEVETDKAAVEIEAEAGGKLAERRAEEGAAVPVGQVVAVIAAEGESASPPATPTAAPEPAHGAGAAPTLPAGTEVILPALGMAQETGTILRWLKAPGAAVTEGEPLFEVETDKAAVEVPAEAGGYLAAVLAGEGAEVPVGARVAVITPEPPEAPIGPDDAPAPAAAAAGAPAAPPEAGTSAPDSAPGGAGGHECFSQEEERAPMRAGRILASPKARRLAAEEGLDLGRLRAAGVPEPYHVADLETLRAMPDEARAVAVAGAASDRLTARVPGAGLAAFLDWAAGEGAGDRGQVLAAFAAGALRRAAPAGGALLVAVEGRGEPVLWADPDRGGGPVAEGRPTLILRDLAGTLLTSVSLGADNVPVLTRAGDETIDLTLEAPAGALPRAALIGLLDGMAARLDEPLRHLL